MKKQNLVPSTPQITDGAIVAAGEKVNCVSILLPITPVAPRTIRSVVFFILKMRDDFIVRNGLLNITYRDKSVE